MRANPRQPKDPEPMWFRVDCVQVSRGSWGGGGAGPRGRGRPRSPRGPRQPAGPRRPRLPRGRPRSTLRRCGGSRPGSGWDRVGPPRPRPRARRAPRTRRGSRSPRPRGPAPAPPRDATTAAAAAAARTGPGPVPAAAPPHTPRRLRCCTRTEPRRIGSRRPPASRPARPPAVPWNAAAASRRERGTGGGAQGRCRPRP